MTYPNTPIVPLSNLYLNGLNLRYVSGTQINIYPGQCYDSNYIYPIISNEIITLNADNNGVNGLDTGTLGQNDYYFVHLIGDPTNQTSVFSKTLLSLQAENPILPYGYSISRRIGQVLTDVDSQIINFYQSGNGSTKYYQYDTPINALFDGSDTAFNLVNISYGVPNPPGFKQGIVSLNIDLTPATAGNSLFVRDRGSAVTGSNCPIVLEGQVAGRNIRQNMVQTIYSTLSDSDTYPYVAYAVTNASDVANIFVAGYYDDL